MAAAQTLTVAPVSSGWLRDILPFIVMCFGMFIALLDIQIVAASLQEIGGGLSAAQDQISWVQTAYLIAEIIMIPLSGWLTRAFSTRWLFTASAAGFTLASLFCGLAWNIESMIVFRALQGLLGASMIPTVFTSSFHYFQGTRRVYSAAVIGTIASIAPTLGPVIGGFITDTLNWHWLFSVNLLPGIAITVLVPLLVPRPVSRARLCACLARAPAMAPHEATGRSHQNSRVPGTLRARGGQRFAILHYAAGCGGARQVARVAKGNGL